MIDRTIWLVVERELRQALRSKGIWALVGLILLGATAVVVLPEVIPDGDDSGEVALVGEDAIGAADALRSLGEPELTIEELPDRAAATQAVEDGDVDLAVLLGGHADAPTVELLVEDESDELVRIVRDVVGNRVAATRLAAQGIDLEDVAAVFSASTPAVSLVDADQSSRAGAAFALTIVLYLITVILTGQVASAVAAEKANHVSEVLLAIVPPRSMLAGKVIGTGIVGMVTVLAGATPVVVRLLSGGDLPEGLGRALVVSSAWFVGGLVLYLTLAGSLGALVARQEEAGAIVTPLTMLLAVGYLVAISAGESVVALVLGIVPLTSPMVAPYRVAIGAGSLVEYAVSVVVLFASVVLLGRLGAVVFRRGIVRPGERLKLRDVL